MREQKLPVTVRLKSPAGVPTAWQPASPPPSHTVEAAPINILAMLRRGWFLVLLSVCASLGGARFYLKNAVPIYRSSARIFIKQAPMKSMGETQMVDQEPANFLATQCEVIKSMQVLSLVAQSPKIRKLPTLAKVSENDLAARFRNDVTVSLDKGVDVISVAYVSSSPKDAAAVVNGVVDAYATFYADQNRSNSEELLKSKEQEKAKREAELQEAQQKFTDFKRAHGETNGPSATRRKEAVIDELTEAHTAAQLKVLDLEEHYGPSAAQVKAAITEEQKIAEMLSNTNHEMVESNGAATDWDILEQTVKSIQSDCQHLDEQIGKLALGSTDSGSSRVAVLDAAQPDFTPVWPAKTRTMGMAALLGIMLGSGLAFLREQMDGRLRDPESTALFLRLPLLGVIPQMRVTLGVVGRGQLVHLDPMSSVAEAYRKVRTAIFFGTPSGGGQSVLVTSPTARDGKSTTAANLAIAMAQTGERVLLIDADFRRPMQHVLFGIKNDNGLTSVLAGRCSLEQAVQQGVVEGLDVMPSGILPPNPSAILNSSFTTLLEELCGRYDRVIFDSPPVLAVADARIIAAHTDVTILTVRSGKSTRKLSAEACAGLAAVGARLFGLVMNGARGRSGSYGAYGYSYVYPTRRHNTAALPEKRNRENGHDLGRQDGDPEGASTATKENGKAAAGNVARTDAEARQSSRDEAGATARKH